MQNRPERAESAVAPDLQEIGQFVMSTIPELNSRIHGLTGEDVEPNLPNQQLIDELSRANVHMAIALQMIRSELGSEVVLEDHSTDDSHEVALQATANSADEKQLLVEGFIDSFSKANQLKDRERSIVKKILEEFSTNQWFKVGEINLAEIEFISDSARKMALSMLTAKLVDSGLLISNGRDKGGRKYQLNETALPDMSALRTEEDLGSKKK